VVEFDDNYTGSHSRSVVEIALEVGQRLGLRDEELRDLEFAALLHDVGKIAIPKAIINKPGTLDPDEWRVVKTHTLEGQRMLDRVGGFMGDVGRIVRSHHERWDGNGYPDGLAGDRIPLAARIIACCDTWHAMTSNRSYRTALPLDVAARELADVAGTQLDPEVVAIVLSIVLPAGAGALAAA
jgi:putative nucleotidyltransferase with HDIG domain